MTKKELRKVEDIAKKIIEDMLGESENILIHDYDYEDEAYFPISVLQEMEAYMGEEIIFMGIS